MANWRVNNDGYDKWKEEQEKKKGVISKSPRNPIQYTNPSYKGESATRKESYQWEKDLLKDLPTKRYGRSYNDKFDRWTQEQGISPSEAREFRRWMDSKDDKVDTAGSATDAILQNMNKRAMEGFERLKKKPKKEEKSNKLTNGFLSKSNSTNSERNGVLGFLDRFVAPISQSIGESMIPGNTEIMAKNSPNNPVVKAMQKDRGLETDILHGAGTVAAFAMPYSKAYGVANTLVNKVPSLARIAKPYAKKAITGASAGLMAEGGVAALNELANPEAYDMKDYATRMAIGAAGGAVLDPALYGLGQIAKSGLSRFAKGDVPTFSGGPSQNVLSNLPTSNSGRINTQSNELFDRLSVLRRPAAQTGDDISSLSISQQARPEIASTVQEPSLNRLRRENLRPGNATETIQPMRGNGGPLKRLDTQGFDRLRNNAGGTADTFRSKVDRTPVKTNKIQEFVSNARTQFIDDLAPLENLEKNIRGKVNSAEGSLYKQGRLFRGSSEKANEIVETQLKPILTSVEKNGYSLEDLGDYALAVHARDVNAKGINSGFTNNEIKSVIDKFNNPVMENARKELIKLNTNLLNNLADSGVIAKESVEQLQKKHPNYMPLFRSFDDDKVEFKNGISKALSVGSSPLKKLEGSSRDVIDPIESIVKNIFRLTNTADRNAVARQLGTLAKEDVEGTFVRQLMPGEEAGRKNVVSAMENGQKVQYEVPPEVYKAMKNMDQESSNFLIKILQKPAATLRAGATLTPEFSLRNPMRDVAQAYIVSNSGFNPITDFPVGLFQTALKGRTFKIAGKEFKAPDKLYRQFLQDNGGLGNIVSIDRDMHRKAIEGALKSNDKKFINVVNPKSWLGVLRTIADVSESATKVGEYRAALRSGTTRQEAAYRARDIMDFARAGVSIREANKVVAFLNANIQGKSKILRAIKENPLKVTMNSLKAVTLPTIGVFMAQQYLASDEQKELIDDAPSWLKNTFWLIPVPGTEQVARIPKPFDIAPIFANIPERTLDYLAKNDPAAFDNFARETLSSYTIPTMLTGFAPIVEGMANYSFFRQGRIIPQREDNTNYPDQYDVNTSETAKALGKGISSLTQGQGPFKNFGSPRIIDNTIRGLTGGLGTYVTDAVDLIVEGTGVVEDVEKPKKDFLTEKSPLRAFLMNKSSTGASIDKLYSLKEKLSKERGSSKLREEDYSNEDLYEEVNDVTKEISDISKEIRAIENHPSMSAESKRYDIDKLNKQRNELAFQSLRDLRRYIEK